MNEILTCKYSKCNKYLLEPILLNCTKNVCKCHVDELIDPTKEEFKCFVCNEKHKMPNDGFVINVALIEILKLKYHLNEEEKNAADLIEKLDTSFSELEKMTKDPENYIFDYFSEIRCKIDLERERIMEEINLMSKEMLEKLKHFEDDCKQNLKKLSNLNKKHKAYLVNFSKEISKFKEVLRTPCANKELLKKLTEDANQLIKKTEVKVLDHRKNLLMDKECFFNGMNARIDRKVGIEFYIVSNLNSAILTSNQFADLIQLCEFDPLVELKLLYQASRDGFSAESFHSKCDGIPNTLTIIKVKGNSNVFGGFCSVTWDESNQYKKDTKAFIYSLINQEKRPMKTNVSVPSLAIYCDASYGPSFGGGLDIYISNDSNKSCESFSNFGDSYASESYPFESSQARNLLAGTYNFQTEEIEVYQVS